MTVESKATGSSSTDAAVAEIVNTSGSYSYAALLGFKERSTTELIERIEKGFTIETLARLREVMEISQKDLAALVQISPSTLARRKKKGKLAPEESDRVLRASRVFGKALKLFEGDRKAATKWLTTSAVALGGETPLAFAKTEVGAREVEGVIGRLEHGIPT